MSPAIVVYDGDCGVCEKCRKALEWLDWFKCFECHKLQEEELYSKFPSLNRDACEKELKLVKQNGRIYGGGDAVVRICLKLPLLFPVGLLFILPPLRPLVRWLYRKVADNRHWISSQCGLEKSE
jgi:predicted DCC family thiol-disulfide oxidoreductase YuxK